MKFDTLTLNNFRQYYGGEKEQIIVFSKSKDKNITVIHGENGAGKTALLNSFLWLFYDKIILPDPQKIVNERAIAEIEVGDEVEIRVQLKFEHDGRKYTVWRRNIVRKESEDDFTGELVDKDFHLEYIDVTGRTKVPGNPEETISQIIPSRLSNLFFFHGEDIDRMSKTENSREIQEAIRNIMGLEILERSIRHLDIVAKKFEMEMEKYGSEELKELIRNKKESQENLESLRKEFDNLTANLDALVEEKGEVDKKLKELKEAKERQERREKLESEVKSVQDSISEKNKEMRKLCGEKAYLVPISGLFIKIMDMIENKREKGEIPSYIKKQFVDDLLNKGLCICNRKLEKNTDPYRAVLGWREKAGLEGLDEAVTLISNNIKEIPQKREKFITELKNLMKKREDLCVRRGNLEEQISEIGQIFEKEREDIQELEKNRKRIDKDWDNTRVAIKIKESDIERIERKIKNIEKDIEEEREKEGKGRLAKERFIVCKRARGYIETLFQNFAKRVRDRIQTKVGDLYSEFINKPYWSEITDDYKLKIFKKIKEQKIPVGMSTGERQIASLAFIGGLVDIAREQYEEQKNAIYFKGGIYPIIMDSPFGNLDKNYRKEIGEGIPKLAEQVIVLVTSTQWGGEVEKAMKKRADREYHLEYYDPNKNPNVEYEYTVIKEVE